MQRSTAIATGYAAAGAPSFLAIKWALGDSCDPYIETQVAQFRFFRKWYKQADTALRDRVSRLWARLYICAADNGVSSARGPVQATLAYLIQA